MVRRQPAAFYLLAIALVLPFSALAGQNGQQPQPPAGGDEATSVDKALSEGLAKRRRGDRDVKPPELDP